MRKKEFVLENGTYKIRYDYEINTDYRIPPKRPDLVLINKKKELVIWWILSFQWTVEGK